MFLFYSRQGYEIIGVDLFVCQQDYAPFTLRAVLRCYVRAVLRRTAVHCAVLRSTAQ